MLLPSPCQQWTTCEDRPYIQVCLQAVAFLARWAFQPVFSIFLGNPCGVGDALEPAPQLPWAGCLSWHPTLHYSPGFCCSALSHAAAWSHLMGSCCAWEITGLCWPELNAGSSVLAFLEHIYKEPCPCFLPVPLAMAAQHLEVCGWPPLSFTAGRGSPPQLEAVGRRWLLELQKSCFSVMGCTTSAVIKNPAAQAPSLPFSSVPLLLPWFSCSLIFCYGFLSLFPFGLLLFLLHTGKENRERARAEAFYSRSFRAVV